MSLQVSQIGSRLVFQNAVAAIKRANMNPSGAVMSQSHLRLETALVAGQTTYNFDVLVNESANGNFNTAVKLNLQDAFVMASIGFYLAVPDSATDTKFRLLTYPTYDADNFSTTTLAKDALAFYNGTWNLTINQRVVVSNWDLQRHLHIPQQQSNAVTAVQTAAAAFAAPIHLGDDEYQGDAFAQFPVEPNVTLVGSKKHQFQVTLPQGIATIPANSRVVCLMRGILAQNVTAVN